MERAQRAADSPLRAILQAAKVRRRAEPDAQVDAEGARRLLAPRPAPAIVEAPPVDALPRMTAIASSAVAGSGAGLPASQVAVRGTEPESPVLVLRTLPTEAPVVVPLRGALEAASITTQGVPEVPAAQVELPLVQAPPVAVAVLPELLYIVEPDIGPRLLELLTRPEVAVEFTIRADGSVTGVRVLPPVPRQWVPPVTAAVEQWRFAPLPSQRLHRVQLVFKNGS